MSLRNRVILFILSIIGSLIAIELSRRNIATQIFKWEIRGIDFFVVVLGFLGLLFILSLISIIIEVVFKPTDSPENRDSDDDSSGEWSLDQLVGCIEHNGVKWIASKGSSGDIQIQNTFCPSCNSQLSYIKDMRDGEVLERSGGIEKRFPTSVPGYDCDNPNCDYFEYLEHDKDLEREVKSLFRQHFDTISRNQNTSIQSLLQDYRERTGDNNPAPEDLWHEYYLKSNDDNVCTPLD